MGDGMKDILQMQKLEEKEFEEIQKIVKKKNL